MGLYPDVERHCMPTYTSREKLRHVEGVRFVLGGCANAALCIKIDTYSR